MNTRIDPTNQPKVKTRTVTWQKISEWQFDNKYILGGYRPAKADYLEIFTSLTFLHNESCNVYTHLIGALLLPLVATTFRRELAQPQFLGVSLMDYAMFEIYFWCAEICLVLSVLYHLMQPHSHRVEQFWHGMDLLGIVVVTMGTFSSGIYYIFFCEASLQKLHWAIVLVTGIVTVVLISNPLLKTPRWRKVKIHAAILGNVLVSTRTESLWHWSQSLCVPDSRTLGAWKVRYLGKLAPDLPSRYLRRNVHTPDCSAARLHSLPYIGCVSAPGFLLSRLQLDLMLECTSYNTYNSWSTRLVGSSLSGGQEP